MEQMSAGAMEAAFDAAQRELDERIDRLLEAHGGSWRAAIEALLMALDYPGRPDCLWLCAGPAAAMTGSGGPEKPNGAARLAPLSPWQLLDLVERRVWQQRGARLTPDSCKVVLDALRAYVANPRRDRIATIICCRIHVRRVPCQPLCRRCLETAFEIKQEINGVPDWFGDRGRHDGGGR